jgi:2-polyprenyl-3-methyl-5-hydroxy-6-metoxy-1,4-benzoquinol methylase
VAEADRNKWNRIYAERERAWRTEEGPELSKPSSFWSQIEGHLPHSGRALDVAGGAGRHAIAMARHGLDVTLADVSEVGLHLAEAAAERAGQTFETLCLDLDAGLPDGPWQLIFVHHFLDRALLLSAASALQPGGLLAICHPTVRNLERHSRPSERFLLQEGELAALLERAQLQLIEVREEWGPEGRHEARALARA